ncbi:unnamed protein product [Prunus armeniaca]
MFFNRTVAENLRQNHPLNSLPFSLLLLNMVQGARGCGVSRLGEVGLLGYGAVQMNKVNDTAFLLLSPFPCVDCSS